jgi:LysR family hydrogen peroxide-inducible transcriptional activator
LLPDLVRNIIAKTPQMPLMLQENFTVKLLELLRTGELDCAILAEPFPDTNLAVAPLYDEPFLAAVPLDHPFAKQASVTVDQLKAETMLLLGTGHCFRDHVLEVCPEFARFSGDSSGANMGIRKSFEGSSLETIKHMVAAGMGVTLVPRLSVPASAILSSSTVAESSTKKSKAKSQAEDALVVYRPITDDKRAQPPTRRVVLVWRKSFTRYEAIAALRNAIYACELPGVTRLS